MPRKIVVFGTVGGVRLSAPLRRRFKVLRILIGASRRPGRFFSDVDRLRQVVGPRWDCRAFDLHTIMCALRAADRFYQSAGLFRETRDIYLAVTVGERGRWRALASTLSQTVALLSGDRLKFTPVWHSRIVARARPLAGSGSGYAPLVKSYEPDCVCLFSGGADSLCGVAHLLVHGRRPLLVSQAVGPISGRQRELFESLRRVYPQLHPEALIQLRAYPVSSREASGRNGWKQHDTLQRLRSMYFFSLAAQVACAHALDDIFMCENGLVGAAIAFSPNQYGPFTTRPAEPHYLRQMQSFLRLALDRPSLSIRNPFQYMTKGEVLADAVDCGIRKLLYRSVSCWRSGNRGVRNCGECVPCMFRQLAFHEAGLREYRSDYYGRRIPPKRWKAWRSNQRRRLIGLHEYCSRVQREGAPWLFSAEGAVVAAIDVTGGSAARAQLRESAQATLDERASEHMAAMIQRFARATLYRLE